MIVFELVNTSKVAAQKINNTDCLEVVGLALTDGNPVDGVTVRLYQENEEMEMTEITSVVYHEHGFKFTLQRNLYYTIEISKSNYVTRTIGISTKLPSDVVANPIFRFEFDVALFKEKKNVNDYYLDFPVALIDYDVKKEVFVSHGKYTNHIKNKINESTQ